MVINQHLFHLKDTVPAGFLGPTLRSGIGNRLTRNLPREDFEAVFNTPAPPEGMKIQKFSEIPKGYLLEVPMHGDRLVPVTMTLLGRINDHRSAFTAALNRIAQEEGFKVIEGDQRVITNIDEPAQAPSMFSVTFDTPTQITMDDIPPLVAEAENVQLLEHTCSSRELTRFSVRQRMEVPMRGLVGTALFRFPEEMAPETRKRLLWALKMLEAVHVGKNTVMGFGKIRVKFKRRRHVNAKVSCHNRISDSCLNHLSYRVRRIPCV